MASLDPKENLATPEEGFFPESLLSEVTPPRSPFSLEKKEDVKRLIGYLEPIANLAPTDDVDFGPHGIEFLTDETLRDINIYRDKSDSNRYIVRVEGLLSCSDAILDVLVKEAKNVSKFFRRERRDTKNSLLEELPDLKQVRIGVSYFPRLVNDKFSIEFITSYAIHPFEFGPKGRKHPLRESRVEEVMSEITDYYLSKVSQYFAKAREIPSAIYGGMTDRDQSSDTPSSAPDRTPISSGSGIPAMA